MIQFTRTLGCWIIAEASGIKSFKEAEFTVYEACISMLASRGAPLKRYCASILDYKVLTDYFLQAEFIYSLINPIITKHLHITLIIKFRSNISRTFSANIISGQ